MPSILVVCTGNICRSPIGERYLASALRADDEVSVTSAGTMALVGDDMDPNARRILVDVGADPDGFRSTQITEQMVKDSDLIIAMAEEHRREIVRMVPSKFKSTYTMLEIAHGARSLSDSATAQSVTGISQRITLLRQELPRLRQRMDRLAVDIPDPYRRSSVEWEKMKSLLLPAIDSVGDYLGS